MLAVIVNTTTQPGQRDEVHRRWETHLKPRVEASDVQPVYVWVDDASSPDRFTLFEIYTDPSAMRANAQSEWFGAYMAEVGPLLAGQPEVTMGSPRYLKVAPH